MKMWSTWNITLVLCLIQEPDPMLNSHNISFGEGETTVFMSRTFLKLKPL